MPKLPSLKPREVVRKGTLVSLLHEAGIEKDEFIDA